MAPPAYPCMLCRKSTNNSHALQCILCELWAHKGCGITEEIFKFCELQKKEMQSAFWVCESCRAFSVKMSKNMKIMDNKIDGLEKKLKKKDEEILKLQKDVSDLQTQFESFKNNVKDPVAVTDDSESSNVQNMMKELSDQEARRCNVICHNIPESCNLNAENRKKDDLDISIELFNTIGVKVGEESFAAIKRLGRKDKTRPLLVVFKNPNLRDRVLANSKQLADRMDYWQEVKISPDLTANQRKHDQNIHEEVEKLNGERTAEESLNFIFRAVGRKGSKKIIKCQETASTPSPPNLNQWVRAAKTFKPRKQAQNSALINNRKGQWGGFRFSTVMLEDY